MLKSLCALLLALPFCAAAGVVGFSGDYAPADWTFTNDAFGNSTLDWSGAPNSATLYRNNAVAPGLSAESSFQTVAAYAGTISFEYFFGTGDSSWNVNHNEFGVIQDSIQTVLFDSVSGNSPNSNYQTYSFAVSAGETFGFFIYTNNNDGNGGESVSISDFDGSTPEPASLILVLGGIGGMVLRRRLSRH